MTSRSTIFQIGPIIGMSSRSTSLQFGGITILSSEGTVLKFGGISSGIGPEGPYGLEFSLTSDLTLTTLTIEGTFITNWGDGTINSSQSHQYTSQGTYTVKISSSDPAVRVQFSDQPTMASITSITNVYVPIMYSMFFERTIPQDVQTSISNWNTSNTITMVAMFNTSNFNKDLSNWDTSNVTDMNYMFGETTIFDQDLSNWNTSNVTDMAGMFSGTTNFNSPVFTDTIKVTSMFLMFLGAIAFNKPLNWNTSNVTNMAGMFQNATNFNSPVFTDTSKVTIMNGMFSGASLFDQDISNWNTINVTDMSSMFYNAAVFQASSNIASIGSWNVSNVTTMEDMFSDVINTTNFTTVLQGWISTIVDNTIIGVNGSQKATSGTLETQYSTKNIIFQDSLTLLTIPYGTFWI
jgi:surface protein